jgi:aerotolerance regulator-like protein
MGALFDGFVNPGLAIGAALAVVPLLIHLLNRQRYKPLPWAAMRFVLAAYRKTRRRARLENLLLLLLRMGAVALLALAVARPFAGIHSPLAGMTESRRDLVLVIDGSASTGYREEVRSVFEKEVLRAREILLGLDGARGDRVRLYLAGAWPRLLSWRTPEEALDLLSTLQAPTDEPLDLAAALGEIAQYAEEQGADPADRSLEIRLLCDLQRRSFLPQVVDSEVSAAKGPLSSIGSSIGAHAGTPAGAPPSLPEEKSTPLLVEQLDRLKQRGLQVLVEDLGPSDPTPANLSVVGVETVGPLLGPRAPADVSITVANHGPNLRTGVRVVLEVDGERRPQKLVEIPARGEAKLAAQTTFGSRGAHTLVARLEADRLAADDSRAQVVLVPPAVRVLLVDGAPAPEPERDEVGFLLAMLQPALGDELPGSDPDSGAADSGGPFEVRRIDAPELSNPDLDLSVYDVIWLANVESFAARTVEKLEQRIALGGALIVSVGNQVRAETYNARLFRADGTGLLPAQLVGNTAVNRRESYFRVQEFQQDHPALALFADERWKPLLTEVPIYEFIAARPLESARVLARLDDPEKSPLLVERAYDRGRTFLWLTSIDADWTRLPESARTLVPLVYDLVRYAGQPRPPQRNVAVNEPLQAEVASFPRKLTLLQPDGSRRSVPGEPQPSGPGAWALPAIAATERAGLYQLELEGAPSIPFAVQLDPREGDLDRLGPNELSAVHPALVLVGSTSSERPDEEGSQPERGELWRPIAAACLAFLVLESLWAAWVGRSRRIG